MGLRSHDADAFEKANRDHGESPVFTLNVCDPGRAAYEAFCAYAVERNAELEAKSWDELPRVLQLAWCAAANAGIDRFFGNTQPLREVPKE